MSIGLFVEVCSLRWPHRIRQTGRSALQGRSVVQHWLPGFVGASSSSFARRRMHSARRDQRHESDIGAAAYALQYHAAKTDRRFDAAVLQRAVARMIEAGIGEIAKTKQRPSHFVGADEQAVACKGGDRGVDSSTRFCSRSTSGMPRPPSGSAATTRMPLPPSGNSSCEQAQVIKLPSAAPKPRRRSSRIAPLAGNREPSWAIWRRWVSAGPKVLANRSAALLGAEQSRADRIGPQHTGAVARPQPDRLVAGGVYGQPCIANAPQLKIRIVHRHFMTDSLGARPVSASQIAGQTMTSLIIR